MPARIERNRAVVEALLPGTLIRITGYGFPWPDMIREQMLEVML
jgi:hypothetical protein